MYLIKWLPQMSYFDKMYERARRAIVGVEQKEPVTIPRIAGETVGVRLYGLAPAKARAIRERRFRETERTLKAKLKGAIRVKDRGLADKYRRQLRLLYERKRREG